jgi:uncharacterized C2H2 Zn-finger protein
MKDNFGQKDISFDIDLENIRQNTITTKNQKIHKDSKKPEIIPNIEDPNEANKEQVLYKCPNCSRKFKREAYAKHVPICARVFQNKKEGENKPEKKEKIEKPSLNDKKPANNKSKWENQSNELRALIHNKRAEKDKNNNDIQIQIEEPKKHTDNMDGSGSPLNSNLQYYKKDGKVFIQCDLCNKKFTKINYESHLNDCKKKYKEKKNGGDSKNNTYNKGGIININNNFNRNININGFNNNNNNQNTRKPMMPAVTYGSNKPKFTVKFNK